MSRVSRKQADKHRHDIVDAAARLFREHGINGVSVPALMAGVGLTHGGFYGHFKSKEQLASLACAHSFSQKVARTSEALARNGGDKARARHDVVVTYLSRLHRDSPGDGCPISALACDVSRLEAGSAVRREFISGLARVIENLTTMMEGRNKSERREAATALLSILVGAVTLARATKNDAMSDTILGAVRKCLTSPDRS